MKIKIIYLSLFVLTINFQCKKDEALVYLVGDQNIGNYIRPDSNCYEYFFDLDQDGEPEFKMYNDGRYYFHSWNYTLGLKPLKSNAYISSELVTWYLNTKIDTNFFNTDTFQYIEFSLKLFKDPSTSSSKTISMPLIYDKGQNMDKINSWDTLSVIYYNDDYYPGGLGPIRTHFITGSKHFGDYTKLKKNDNNYMVMKYVKGRKTFYLWLNIIKPFHLLEYGYSAI